MKIFAYGTKVETVSGKYIGIITASIIRHNLIQYEVSYFSINGLYEKAVLTEKEFNVIGEKDKVEIGYKRRQLPNT